MSLVESVTRFTVLAAIVPAVLVVAPGCSKKDEAPPPLPSATAEPVAPPTPAPSAALPIAPMAPAPGQAPNTLAEAITVTKPSMKDSTTGPDEGATALLNYWLQKNYAWSQLEAIPASTGAMFLSSTDAERGKRICGAGVIQTFSKVSDNPKQHEATIATPEGLLSVGAVGDVTGMKQGGQGRFCGIASGVQTIAGQGGAQTRAIRTTGYFDTPANRGGGTGGGIGNLRACCQALAQNSTSMPPPNNMYAAAAASYCNASVASISNPAQKDAVLAGIRGALRGVPMPAVCR